MSRGIDILKSIQSGETYNKDALSRAEEILKAICNNTSITMTARSRYETLLLCLKNKTKTTLEPRSRLEEILVAIINGTTNEWLVGKNFFLAKDIVSEDDIEIYSDRIRINKTQDTFWRTTEIPALKPNTTYTLSLKVKGEYTGRIYAFYGDSIYADDLQNGSYSKTFNTDENGVVSGDKYRIAIVQNQDSNKDIVIAGECIEIYDIKIEQGSTATPYSPYCFLSELEEEYYKTFGA